MNMGLMIYKSFLDTILKWMITLQFNDYISNVLAIYSGVPSSDQSLALRVQMAFWTPFRTWTWYFEPIILD